MRLAKLDGDISVALLPTLTLLDTNGKMQLNEIARDFLFLEVEGNKIDLDKTDNQLYIGAVTDANGISLTSTGKFSHNTVYSALEEITGGDKGVFVVDTTKHIVVDGFRFYPINFQQAAKKAEVPAQTVEIAEETPIPTIDIEETPSSFDTSNINEVENTDTGF